MKLKRRDEFSGLYGGAQRGSCPKCGSDRWFDHHDSYPASFGYPPYRWQCVCGYEGSILSWRPDTRAPGGKTYRFPP